MAIISRPNKPVGGLGGPTWVTGADLYASELDSDIQTIYDDYNGRITNANIKSDAAIEGTKLADAPFGIPTAKLNTGAVGSSAQVVNNIITKNHLKTTVFTSFTLPASIGPGNFAAVNTTFGATKIPLVAYIEQTDENSSDLLFLSFHFLWNVTTSTWWLTVAAPANTGTYTNVANDAVKAIFLDVS